MTFSAPMQLGRPIDAANLSGTILTLDQDVEPRIAHDTLANYYVAAIQGVPGGVDVWKSVAGGATFSYLGQPDSLQSGSSLGAERAAPDGGHADPASTPSGRAS